jgi:hypothetical protein
LFKGFESLIHGQVVAHVERSNFLSEFRRGHSTTTVLVRVTEDLSTGVRDSKFHLYADDLFVGRLNENFKNVEQMRWWRGSTLNSSL